MKGYVALKVINFMCKLCMVVLLNGHKTWKSNELLKENLIMLQFILTSNLTRDHRPLVVTNKTVFGIELKILVHSFWFLVKWI